MCEKKFYKIGETCFFDSGPPPSPNMCCIGHKEEVLVVGWCQMLPNALQEEEEEVPLHWSRPEQQTTRYFCR